MMSQENEARGTYNGLYYLLAIYSSYIIISIYMEVS